MGTEGITGSPVLKNEVRVAKMQRKAINQQITLAFALIATLADPTKLSRRMNDLYNSMESWNAIAEHGLAAVMDELTNPATMMNRYDKAMNMLADKYVEKLVLIKCSYCQFEGMLRNTVLCTSRFVGSGFEAIQQLPNRSAPRNTESHFDYDKYEWVNTVTWGLADTLVAGQCSPKGGPYQGGKAHQSEVALAEIDAKTAELILEHASRIGYDLRSQLRTIKNAPV